MKTNSTNNDIKILVALTAFYLFLCLVILSMGSCPAEAAKKPILRPLCNTPQKVRLHFFEEPFWDAQLNRAVTFWNNKLGFHAFVVAPRIFMSYGNDEIPPNYVGIRSAPEEMLKRWVGVDKAPQRTAVAHSRFSIRDQCIKGTAIWIKQDCIAPEYIAGDGCVTEDYLYLVLVHELGHALGLWPSGTHSDYDLHIMHKSTTRQRTKLELAPDTKRQLQELYGSVE